MHRSGCKATLDTVGRGEHHRAPRFGIRAAKHDLFRVGDQLFTVEDAVGNFPKADTVQRSDAVGAVDLGDRFYAAGPCVDAAAPVDHIKVRHVSLAGERRLAFGAE